MRGETDLKVLLASMTPELTAREYVFCTFPDARYGDHAELAPWAIYTVTGSRGTVHVLVQGDYADVESARAARDAFPRRVQKTDQLWIRRFAMVQALLER